MLDPPEEIFVDAVRLFASEILMLQPLTLLDWNRALRGRRSVERMKRNVLRSYGKLPSRPATSIRGRGPLDRPCLLTGLTLAVESWKQGLQGKQQGNLFSLAKVFCLGRQTRLR